MKSFKILTASVLTTIILTGCTQEVEYANKTGIDTSKPTVTDLTYETSHGSKSVTMSWDATEAVAANATSFTVQFVVDYTGDDTGVDMYDSTISTTVSTDTDDNGNTLTAYSATLTGQTVGDIYYIRVRVNYKNSKYSSWVYLSDDDGNPARYKVGRGIITSGIEDPYLYKVTPTSSSIIVKWDAIDDATGYEIAYKLSSDESWTIMYAGAEDVSLKIAELPSETEYDVRGLTETASGNSDWGETHTVTTRAEGSFPQQMSTADEFIDWIEGGIVEVDEDDTYEIMNDIDLSDYTYTAQDESLLGTFNGNGYTVSGVSSTLFYENEGTITNVTIKGAISSSDGEVAALVLTNRGTVSKVTSEVSITYIPSLSLEMYVGGLVAYNYGNIAGSTNAGAVSVSTSSSLSPAIIIGGIAAWSSGKIGEDSVNSGAVSFSSSSSIKAMAVGGIVGWLEGEVDKTSNTGDVSLSASYLNGKGNLLYYSSVTPGLGGICGYGYSNDFGISNCVNDGTVTYSLTSIDSYTSAIARVNIGGIVGNPYGTVENCTNNGAIAITVATSDYSAFGTEHITCVGGIGGGDFYAGDGQDLSNYTNCVNNGNITYYNDAYSSNSVVGGICGWPGAESVSRSNITKDCVNYGNITVSGNSKSRVGGIHGGSGSVSGCTNYGNITLDSGNSACCAGGICGFTSNSGNSLKVVGVHNYGNVLCSFESTYGIGGIIGNIGNASFTSSNLLQENSSVSCKVQNGESSNTKTGMVIGYFNGTSNTITGGSSSSPILVKGSIVLNGTTTKITASNVDTYKVGTTNDSNHTIYVTFDTSGDDDDDDDDDDSGSTTLDAPTNVSVEVLYGSVTVSWDAVNGAEWYVVEYKKDSESSWSSTDQVTDTSYTFEDLDYGTSYEFRVRAYSTAASDWSSAVEAITPTDYTINTVEEFVEWFNETAPSTADGILLGADMDLSGYTLTTVSSFGGSINGQGHSLKNLSITEPLITTNNGILKNIVIDKSVNFNPTATSGNIAVLVGANAGTVKGCTNNASVTVSSNLTGAFYLAGLVATSTGTVSYCTNNGDITVNTKSASGNGWIGGVVAMFSSSDGNEAVSSCENTGDLKVVYSGTPKLTHMGGVAGGTLTNEDGSYVNQGTVVNCSNSGSIYYRIETPNTGTYANVGGVVGYIEGDAESLTNSGDVSYDNNLNNSASCSRPAVGGVVGCSTFSMSDCSNSGKISLRGSFVAGTAQAAGSGGSHQVLLGGIAGVVGPYSTGSTTESISNCYNTGSITSDTTMGTTKETQSYQSGVVGYLSVPATGCYNSGTLSLQIRQYKAFVGGVAGGTYSNLSSCYNTGSITLDVSDHTESGNYAYQDYVGGVFGAAMVTGLSFSGLENKQDATITLIGGWNTAALSYIGGVMGTYNTGSGFTMENSTNDGTITVSTNGSVCAGGLCGAFNGTMTSGINNGGITANSAGTASGKESEVAGLVGYLNGTLTACASNGAVSNSATGTYTGGLVGRHGSASKTWAGCTVNCTIVGETAGSCLGGFRSNTGDYTITLGSPSSATTVTSFTKLNGEAATADNALGESTYGKVNTEYLVIE